MQEVLDDRSLNVSKLEQHLTLL
ncbi:hypothetical protein CP061683_0522A, partial [Chlamydia psittaci 06-1683]